MREIPLKVLIIDSSEESGKFLQDALKEFSIVIATGWTSTLKKASSLLKQRDINTIYIDPVSIGVKLATDFIRRVRNAFPVIVFVLYTDIESARDTDLFKIQDARFTGYFKLDKLTPAHEFQSEVERTISLCQGDLSFNLTQEKIAGLQSELTEIQKGASEEEVSVPIQIIEELKEQLKAREEERSRIGKLGRPAAFLGPASSMKTRTCFVIMPYSKSWSESVESLIKSVCEIAGLEFKIAKAMDGRFVAHDIWRGVTSSEVIIADLTDANPNVTYEVGLADAIGRRVVLIAQDDTVPFDFHGHRLILYENTIEGGSSSRKTYAVPCLS